jgi:hypothetical protein
VSEFYVCNKNDGEHGGWMDGCMVWWRAEGKGYTYDLNLAGIFTEEDQAKHYPDPKTCRYIPREVVDANTYSPRLAFWSRALCGPVEIRRPQKKGTGSD